MEKKISNQGEMVNLVTAIWSLLRWLMKMSGLRTYEVEIEPGTMMRFWVPSETISKPKNSDEKPKLVSKPSKPVVVLVHGFCGDGLANWQFQLGSLTKMYAVYVPDLLFFGGSFTDKPERSPAFQAKYLAAGLRKLGVEKCSVVGFSYGGAVAFKMAELYPELVQAIVISGLVLAMMDSMLLTAMQGVGYSSCSELLMPTSVKGVKSLLAAGTHRNLWLPRRLHKDFLEVMYSNRKERDELLEAFEISYKDINIPNFSQRILLLWGENDKIFKLELAQIMKEKLGNNARLQGIKKAGHLVHLERPCVYNRCLKQFLSSALPGIETHDQVEVHTQGFKAETRAALGAHNQLQQIDYTRPTKMPQSLALSSQRKFLEATQTKKMTPQPPTQQDNTSSSLRQ
ncbi:uncharacterized protein LOC133288540 [Gastrolobium bilobum]|uniref:uncharacterized protein LOC133288540 n=1 Tax=Gastrolobium bilobum TaxID=150636 RepID=UPI002AB325D5|nr:uncharacterized protein LOC133288540 [Gastrolobium bilobum]